MDGYPTDRPRPAADAAPDAARSRRIAVLVPCYNEAAAVTQVIADFSRCLPGATVYVFDNGSQDATAELARQAGATVRCVRQPGKGNVVRRMFADVEADAYVLVDGDGTYEAAAAPRLVAQLFDEGLDMVVGTRRETGEAAWRPGHRWGNRMLSGVVATIFGHAVSDMLSGYRVFSQRYVKSFPALAHGFEIETELTVHALQLRMPIAEQDTRYGARMAGSASKLSTYRDGARIGLTIGKLVAAEKPLAFYAGLCALLSIAALALGVPVVLTYLHTGLVPRFPTAILATGIAILACLALACGLILEGVTLGRKETKRLAYLAYPAPS